MDEQTNRGWRWGVGPVALALTLGAPLTACNYELHNDVITDASTDTGGDETATGETGSTGSTGGDETTMASETDGGETDTTEPPPDFPPVNEPGPHNVGFRTMDVVYTPDLPGSAARVLEVAVWYPTADTSGVPAKYFDFVDREEVYLQAHPIPDTQLPVLLFSHGNGGVAEQTFTLCEHFASHGWLVIAPDHTDNTLIDIDPDLIPLMVLLRPQDIIASLEAVRDLPADDPLVDKVGDEIVMSGHSFGGYTTLALAGGAFDVQALEDDCGLDPSGIACEALADPNYKARLEQGFGDSRIDVALPLAPGAVLLFGEAGLGAIDIPVQLSTASLDETTPDSEDGDPAWAGLNGADDRRVEYLTGGHYTFTYACAAGLIEGDGCGDEFIDPELAADVLNAYTLGFARARLWGDESVRALLDGDESLTDEVVVQTP
ncbi:MAG: hypothetical protein H6713_14725 [Myxococcales bacterium]|nr:hypothetical protein [Myxococcales bacterium]MCB9751228.1 hypothetical protein [Myxococcales bacterium]